MTKKSKPSGQSTFARAVSDPNQREIEMKAKAIAKRLCEAFQNPADPTPYAEAMVEEDGEHQVYFPYGFITFRDQGAVHVRFALNTPSEIIAATAIALQPFKATDFTTEANYWRPSKIGKKLDFFEGPAAIVEYAKDLLGEFEGLAQMEKTSPKSTHHH